MTQEIELDGFDELTKALDDLTDRTQALAVTAMTKSCLAVEGILKEYPEETESNRPGRINKDGRPMGFYERNRGEWYPIKNKPKGGVSKFGKALGIIRAKKAQREQGVFAYKLIPSSQQLGKSWTTDIQVGKAEIIGVVGTDVTYAPEVQGLDQLALFAAIGWLNLDQSVDRATPDIQAAWQEMLSQVHF